MDDIDAKRINILDCTLRDGSYAIDYQFTAEDTAMVATGLEQAGFELIEIGHGLGMNASNCGKGAAAATDREYLEVASSILKKAKFGMFFIPGIGREEDLILAAEYGMDFVRIGTNINEVEDSAKYIKIAKDLGMSVSANFMKSYAFPPDKFLKEAKKSEKYGADVLTVVDSVGVILPQEVSNYVSVLKDNTDLDIGFHGHNNLMLAVSNTLEAIKAGATVVDTSLQGMGRSAGNAQTEIIVLLLEKLGYSTGIDIYKTMNVAEKILKPLMKNMQGVDSISATAGYAQFHSSFLKTVYEVAQKHQIDPRELIVRISEVDQINVSDELAEAIAKELVNERKINLTTKYVWNSDLNFSNKFQFKDAPVGVIANKLANEMLSLAKKTGKYSVFTIAASPNPNKIKSSFPFIRQNSLCIIGNAEIANFEEAKEIAKNIDGIVDIILVDVEIQKNEIYDASNGIMGVVNKSKLLTYKDRDAMVDAIDSIISQLVLNIKTKISIIGDFRIYKLAMKLAERGAIVVIWEVNTQRLENVVDGLNMILSETSSGEIHASSNRLEAAKGADILISMSSEYHTIKKEILEVMQRNGLIMDAGVRTIHPDAIEYGISNGFNFYRLDMRAGLSGEITNVLETMELVDKIMGIDNYKGAKVVAGGVLGRKGDIVVDSILAPTKVIGVADGKGGLLEEEKIEKYQKNVSKVTNEMLSRKLLNSFNT